MRFFIISTLLMGAAGFLAGFLGPIGIEPSANQGPLLGILITGPLGVVAGAILGVLIPRIVHKHLRMRILLALATTTFFAVLAGIVCVREPEFVGRLYSAEITNPHPAVELLPSAIKKWEDMAKQYAHAPRGDWRDDRSKMIHAAGGNIVTMRNVMVWDVHRRRKPWNMGRLMFTAQPPEVERDAYLASSFELDSLGWFLSHSSGVPAEWPPRNVGDFLGVVEIIPTPPEFRPPK